MNKVKIDFSNANSSNLSLAKELNILNEYDNLLKSNIEKHEYNFPESSVLLGLDKNFIAEAKSLASSFNKDKLKYIFIVGIGGSNLGTYAINNALYKTNELLTGEFPAFVFLDALKPDLIDSVSTILEKDLITSIDDFVINIISKSGNTTETMVNSIALLNLLEKKFRNEVSKQVVVTTDSGSAMENLAKENKLKILNLPKMVGGRYSVFTNVGLFPLLLKGINVEDLLTGASDVIKKEIQNGGIDVKTSAILIYENYLQGKNIKNHFIFNPELEYFGKWYQQLLGESVGKEFNLANERVNIGITPITSIGSTDLHSLAQLFFGGPKDKFTTLIYSKFKNNINTKAINKLNLTSLVSGIENRDFSDIQDAIYNGTRQAYINNQIDFVEILVEDIDEFTLGFLMQFKMLEVIYLAKLLNLNAFDQPNVEDYKKVTREILAK